MRCIVTGGSGFIGRNVAKQLKDNGHEAIIIDRIGDNIFEVDICDTSSLIRVFQETKPDVAFHLAAIADARQALADPVKAVHVNIEGTASVLEAGGKAS